MEGVPRGYLNSALPPWNFQVSAAGLYQPIRSNIVLLISFSQIYIF